MVLVMNEKVMQKMNLQCQISEKFVYLIKKKILEFENNNLRKISLHSASV